MPRPTSRGERGSAPDSRSRGAAGVGNEVAAALDGEMPERPVRDRRTVDARRDRPTDVARRDCLALDGRRDRLAENSARLSGFGARR
jgi:hypothetical protein